jgi:hypothetical protein
MTTSQLFRHLSAQAAQLPATLIDTPLQRSVGSLMDGANPFNGLTSRAETVKTVSIPALPSITPLKRGANESHAHVAPIPDY